MHQPNGSKRTPSCPVLRIRSTAGNGDVSIAVARQLPIEGATCSVKTFDIVSSGGFAAAN